MYNGLSFTNSKVGMWKELTLKEISTFFVLKNLKGGINQTGLKWEKDAVGEAEAEKYIKSGNCKCKNNGKE